MPKEPSLIIKICEKITTYTLYAAVFLLPIFFLPFTSDVLDFNKQALLMMLAFAGLIAWIIKSLVSGSFTVNTHRLNWLVGALFAATLLSSVFSVFRYGSFWGWPSTGYESLLSLGCLCIIYFLVANTFTEREISQSFLLLAVSSIFVQAFAILQLFSVHLLWFDFSKNIYFNTVGSIGALGLYCAMLLPICMIFLMLSKRWWKLVFAANVIMTLVLLVLINYGFLWWLVLVSCFVMIVLWVLRREAFDGTWMFLPAFFIMLSLFFIIFHPQINILPQKSLEVSLSQSSNLAIDTKVLMQSPVTGTGPGTFLYDFLKYKIPSLNNSSFWNIQFTVGSSKYLTALATTGILGFLALLALIVSVLWYGALGYMFEKSPQKAIRLPLLLVSLLAMVTVAVAGALYASNLPIEFLMFFLIAASAVLAGHEEKTYVLKPSSLLTLGVTFAFTAVGIFGTGLLVLEAQRYVAQVNYSKGVVLVNEGKIDEALVPLQKAAGATPVDLYFRQLAQAYIFQVQNLIKDETLSKEDKTAKLQGAIANAINAAKIATDLSPKNANNWSLRGGVYQNLIGAVTDADTWAITSFTEAAKLDPQNPYFLLQMGMVYYQDKDYENARTQLEKAASLKPDYSDVLYVLGLTYVQESQKDKALATFTSLLQLNPKNQDVQKIVSNLKAGKPALEGLGQAPAVTPPPVTP